MIAEPYVWNRFELVVVASLRTHQLSRGCAPRVTGQHRKTTVARLEAVAGMIPFDRPPRVVAGVTPAPNGSVASTRPATA